MYLVFLMYALFASIFTVAKATLEYASPCFLLGFRMIIAGIIILSYFVFKWLKNRNQSLASLVIEKPSGQECVSLSTTSLMALILPCISVSFFTYYLTNVLEFWGLAKMTSAKACFIYNLSPFVSALISYAVLKEKMSFMRWIGLIIGFLGMMIIFYDGDFSYNFTSLMLFQSGDLFLVGAVVSSAYGWILMRKLRQVNYNFLWINGVGMLIGGLLSLGTSFILESWDPTPVTNWAAVLKGSAYMLVVSNLLAYNLYSYLLKLFSATFISFAGFVTPLFAAVYGIFFLNESLSWDFVAASGIVFVGLYLFYKEELKKEGITVRQE